jgi:hypothetical protein
MDCSLREKLQWKTCKWQLNSTWTKTNVARCTWFLKFELKQAELEMSYDNGVLLVYKIQETEMQDVLGSSLFHIKFIAQW